ncbi:MAG: hypothetical protein Q7V19_10145 [Bacteroidales bacterium]|nr:hypothetical protein [Bacteroidales bacterium]
MNKDYSIQASIEKIQNNNTKEYFIEVYQTFVNENYRSSLVMLYSVLICDLIYKLRDLRDLYNDSKAKKILDEIEAIQNANPKSPDWETKLIEFISNRMTLLEPSDKVAIESLQKYRHLSAHPVLTNSDLLYSPNKDTVRSLIRNILTGVLINPPFFSNRIFDTFLNDLSDIKDKITDNYGLKKYLTSRYLNRLKDNDLKKLFRSLWKIVFISEDTLANENRSINHRALKIILAHNEPLCLELIENESNYYSNITKDKALNQIALLLSHYPSIFKKLENSLQQLLSDHISKDDNLKLVTWFLQGSLKKHWKYLKTADLECLKEEYIQFLKKLAVQNACVNDYIVFIIDYFGNSNSFDTTQTRYENALTTILEDITLEQLKKLLKVSNENSQIYHRIGMPHKLKRIVSDRFEGEIEESDYDKIFK